MIRGVQRQMVVVKTEKSENFELAYFVMRTDKRGVIQKGDGSESVGVIEEANRIVGEVCGHTEKVKTKGKRERIFTYLAGMLSGCGAALSIGALIKLVIS